MKTKNIEIFLSLKNNFFIYNIRTENYKCETSTFYLKHVIYIFELIFIKSYPFILINNY